MRSWVLRKKQHCFPPISLKKDKNTFVLSILVGRNPVKTRRGFHLQCIFVTRPTGTVQTRAINSWNIPPISRIIVMIIAMVRLLRVRLLKFLRNSFQGTTKGFAAFRLQSVRRMEFNFELLHWLWRLKGQMLDTFFFIYLCNPIGNLNQVPKGHVLIIYTLICICIALRFQVLNVFEFWMYATLANWVFRKLSNRKEKWFWKCETKCYHNKKLVVMSTMDLLKFLKCLFHIFSSFASEPGTVRRSLRTLNSELWGNPKSGEAHILIKFKI